MSLAQVQTPTMGTYRGILRTWLPLGCKQFLMFAADPVYIAIIMRMEYPNLELGALYSFVWPLLLLIIAPSLALTTVGNIFGRNLENLRRTRNLAFAMGLGSTLILAAIAFTPLHATILGSVMDVPARELGMTLDALGIFVMYPMLKVFAMLWQGFLIRGGRAGDVLKGRMIRLVGGLTLLLIGFETRVFQGAVLGAAAVVGSLAMQTVYLGWRIRLVQARLAAEPLSSEVSTYAQLVRFAFPMSLVPIVGSATVLMMAGSLGRLPGVIASLAVWPIVSNFNQIGVGLGKSFDQVVIVHGVDDDARRRLRRFGFILGTGLMVFVAILNASGLLEVLLRTMEALDPATIRITLLVMWIFTPMPLLLTGCAFYRGLLAREHRPVPILMSKIAAFVIVAAVLGWSLDRDPVVGVYAVATATVIAALVTMVSLILSLRLKTRTE